MEKNRLALHEPSFLLFNKINNNKNDTNHVFNKYLYLYVLAVRCLFLW